MFSASRRLVLSLRTISTAFRPKGRLITFEWYSFHFLLSTALNKSCQCARFMLMRECRNAGNLETWKPGIPETNNGRQKC